MKTYYSTTFTMINEHKYSLTELENMLPWERDMYVTMLVSKIREENERIKLENQQKRSGRR